MKITEILIDLDDTLNSFTMPALNEVGCPVGPYEYSAFDPTWGMDIVTAANNLYPGCTFTKKEFWDSLSEEFWANVPISREADRFLSYCEFLVGKENVCILTAFHLSFEQSYVAAAKADWIKHFLPPWLHGSFLIGPNKKFCAHPGALLIDDSSSNVQRFKEGGGQAITVPRPWTLLHEKSAECLEHVKSKMRGLLEWV